MTAHATPTVHFAETPSLIERDPSQDGSNFSVETVSSAEIDTPDDSPYPSVIELVSSDMNHMNGSPTRTEDMMDELETPRAPHAQFSEVPWVTDSPAKSRPFSRVVGRAKSLVKALVHRKPTRKSKVLVEPLSESHSAFAVSSAIPGGWREGTVRPPISVLVTSETDSDMVQEQADKRMFSASSITGIYSPDDPRSPAPSLASLFSSQLSEADTFASSAESTAQSPLRAGGKPALLPTLLRVALFLPWCVVVGAAILLFPKQLEPIVFSTGYLPTPPRGLRRFSFWTDMAADFVKIFTFALLALWTADAGWGAIVTALAAGRFSYVWLGFKPRLCCLHEHIGEDDMESFWLLLQDQTYIVDMLENCCSPPPAEGSPDTSAEDRNVDKTPTVPASVLTN